MDSGTHLAFGLGLAGLAMTDPVLASDPNGPFAALVGTILGSQAPDFDGLLRFKSNADYIRHHRGLSHSLPFVAAWTAAIALLDALLFPTIPWWHLALWILLAVAVHVLADMFNSYGTMALWPFSRKRIRWNVIHIFDPVILALHLAAIVLWASGQADPRALFPVMYGLLILYYGWRTWTHRRVTRLVPRQDAGKKPGDRYTVLPAMPLNHWNVIRESEDGTYAVGEWDRGRLAWIDVLKCDRHPAAEASKRNKDVQALLNLTPFPCAQVKEKDWGYEVRWADIRYHYRRQYPFVAVVLMDADYKPLQSCVGWLSDERLERRLKMNSY